MSPSSTIIRHLEKYCNSSPRLAHAYFYFDFNDTQKQNATNFLSSVLCQLCCKVLDLPLKIKEIYLRFTNGSFKATVHDLVAAVSGFARTEQLDDIFIVADALDECPTFKGEREEVLDVIRDIVALSPSNLHLIVTSRPELDIKEKLSTVPTLSSLSIQNSDAKVDIKTYIADCLAKDSKLKGWSNDVKVLIEDRLANGAKGM
jgi:ankyrin repeat domain-containing protein 50